MEETTKLLDELRADKPAALEQAIRTYSPCVAAVIACQLGSFGTQADVEELTSDVFFALWQWRNRLKTDNLRGWLMITARNKARDWLRKQKLVTTELEDWLCLPDDQAQRLLETKERNELLGRALDNLDEETRMLILRHYFYGQSTADMAVELDMNRSTIKNRLARGRKKLKDILKEGGCDLED